MGCCPAVGYIVCGGCCCNAQAQFPPKLGCSMEGMICCIDCKACIAVGEAPLPCCCIGPTLACGNLSQCTLCKLKGELFFLKCVGSFPCQKETPIICTLLPCCTIYPRRACCVRPEAASAHTGAPESFAPGAEKMER